MRNAAALVLFVTALICAGCGKVADNTHSDNSRDSQTDDKTHAQGKWSVVKMDVPDGKSSPPAEMLAAVEVDIQGNRVTITKQGEKGWVFHGVFILNDAKSPKELDLTETDEGGNPEARMLPTGKGRAMAAIYKFDGEILMIAAPPKPGELRPTDFKPTPRSPDRTSGGVAVVYLKKK